MGGSSADTVSCLSSLSKQYKQILHRVRMQSAIIPTCTAQFSYHCIRVVRSKGTLQEPQAHGPTIAWPRNLAYSRLQHEACGKLRLFQSFACRKSEEKGLAVSRSSNKLAIPTCRSERQCLNTDSKTPGIMSTFACSHDSIVTLLQ